MHILLKPISYVKTTLIILKTIVALSNNTHDTDPKALSLTSWAPFTLSPSSSIAQLVMVVYKTSPMVKLLVIIIFQIDVLKILPSQIHDVL